MVSRLREEAARTRWEATRVALLAHAGNVTRAARELGMKRQSLSKYIQRHPTVAEGIRLRRAGHPPADPPAAVAGTVPTRPEPMLDAPLASGETTP